MVWNWSFQILKICEDPCDRGFCHHIDDFYVDFDVGIPSGRKTSQSFSGEIFLDPWKMTEPKNQTNPAPPLACVS